MQRLITRYSINHIYGKPTAPKHQNEDTFHSGYGIADPRQVESVHLFLVIIDIVTSAHVPLDATSNQFV